MNKSAHALHTYGRFGKLGIVDEMILMARQDNYDDKNITKIARIVTV